MKTFRKISVMFYALIGLSIAYTPLDLSGQPAAHLINEIEVSPDGTLIAVGYSDGQLLIIDNTTEAKTRFRLAETGEGVKSLAWSSDSTWLASGNRQGEVEIWNVSTKQRIASHFIRHGAVMSLDWFSDDNRILATLAQNGARILDITSGQTTLDIPSGIGEVHSAALHPGDARFLVGGIRELTMWDTQTGLKILTVETGNFEIGTVWNSTGDQFFSISVGIVDGQRSLDIRDGVAGALVRSLNIPDNLVLGSILENGWSPDDRYIYTGSLEGFIHVWNAETGEFIESIEYDGQVFGLDILPDSSQFVYGGVPNRGQPATVQYADVPAIATGNTDQAIIRFVLVDADGDEDLRPLADGDTITEETITIRVETEPPRVGSVVFGLDDEPRFKVENEDAYALKGDDNGDYHAWLAEPGTYRLRATPYTEADGQGEAGTPLTITFTVAEPGS